MNSAAPRQRKTGQEDSEFLLWVALYRATKALLRARQQELRQYGLSTAQTSVLHCVHDHKNRITPAEISRELMRDPNSISELLKTMEKDGLLKRVKDLPRKNMIRVELTHKGHMAYGQTTTVGCYTTIFSALSPKEQQELKSYLMRVISGAVAYLQKR